MQFYFLGQLAIVQAVLFLLIFESHQLDTFCDFDDTFLPAYEIPLILPADTMIMLEVEDQQDKKKNKNYFSDIFYVLERVKHGAPLGI